MKKGLLLLLCVLPTILLAQKNSKKDYVVTISTSFGEMKAVLYDQTPLHKQNFLKLINQRFYDSLLFHRVIDKFMIQGGDPNSKRAKPEDRLGGGGGNLERIPAEFRPELFHKKGALAAARDNNPEKKSSACQFYIVQGRVHNDSTLTAQLKRLAGARIPTSTQKQVYQTLGGTPHLDGNYTVFGEVISGLAVIDSIATRPRNAADRPLTDVRMNVRAELMRKKKIKKLYGYEAVKN